MFSKLLRYFGYQKIIKPVKIEFDHKITKVTWSDGTMTVSKSKHADELPAIKVSRCFMKKFVDNDYIGTFNNWIKDYRN